MTISLLFRLQSINSHLEILVSCDGFRTWRNVMNGVDDRLPFRQTSNGINSETFSTPSIFITIAGRFTSVSVKKKKRKLAPSDVLDKTHPHRNPLLFSWQSLPCSRPFLSPSIQLSSACRCDVKPASRTPLSARGARPNVCEVRCLASPPGLVSV